MWDFQGTDGPTRSATSTKDILRCTNIEAPKISLNDGLRQLYQLSQEANELGRQQQRNVLTAERLQERLQDELQGAGTRG